MVSLTHYFLEAAKNDWVSIFYFFNVSVNNYVCVGHNICLLGFNIVLFNPYLRIYKEKSHSEFYLNIKKINII